jgi:hypothetical protein
VDQAARELLVARVASGTVRLVVPFAGRDCRLVVRLPDRGRRYEAAEVYAETLRKAELEGLFSDDDVLSFLLAEGLWDEDRQGLLDNLPKEIEEFKVQLFKATFKANERKSVRAALRVAREKLAGLSSERHAYDHLTCRGVAAVTRARFLLGASLFTPAGDPAFPDGDAFWGAESGLLDAAMAAHAACRPAEADFRLAARTEPWRSTWAVHKADGSVFGVPACDYTDEQRALAGWSGLYDSVYQHPDCPADDVIGDDDLLDGWLIDQRRQREQRTLAREGDKVNQDAAEVFIPTDTAEGAKKVMALNDSVGRALLKQRFELLRQKGQVAEQEMPDTRRRLRMEATQMLVQQAKGA